MIKITCLIDIFPDDKPIRFDDVKLAIKHWKIVTTKFPPYSYIELLVEEDEYSTLFLIKHSDNIIATNKQEEFTPL